MIAEVAPTPTWYLVLAAVLFGIGAVGVARAAQPARDVHVRRADAQRGQPEFVALSTRLGDIDGQTAVFFVLVVAAAEVVVGLGIIVSILRRAPAPPPTTSPSSRADGARTCWRVQSSRG